jgi:hypothetical protein
LRTPAGQEDMPRIELADRGERVFAFPLAGVSADENE